MQIRLNIDYFIKNSHFYLITDSSIDI